jgi:hypothetical protein
MAYKFQLGSARLSGSLNVIGDLTSSMSGGAGGTLTNISASGEFRGGGLQLSRITGSAGFYTTGSDGILWINSRDGKVVAMTPTNLAANLAGDGLSSTTGSVKITVDDTTVEVSENAVQVKALGIDTGQLAMAAVTFAKVEDVAANSLLVRNAGDSGVLSELALTTTKIMIGNGAGFTAAALSGDVTMTNAGLVTIADDAVETDMILDANVTTAKFASGSVTRAKIGQDAVGPAQINIFDDALAATSTHFLIADGTDYSSFALSSDVTCTAAGVVTIANDAVVTAKLASGSVTRPKIGGDAVGPEQILFIDDGLVATSTHFLIADGTDYSSFALSGDITCTVGGVVSIGTTKVTDAMINDDVASTLAGDGLAATAGVLAVVNATNGGLAVNANDMLLDFVDLAAKGAALVTGDEIAIIDSANLDESRRVSMTNLGEFLAGTGITNTGGILSVDTSGGDSMTSTAVIDNSTLTAGMNYFTGTIDPSLEWIEVSLPASPTAGDLCYLKAPSNCGTGNRVNVEVSGSHKIDGLTQVILQDPYASVGFVYVATNSWTII